MSSAIGKIDGVEIRPSRQFEAVLLFSLLGLVVSLLLVRALGADVVALAALVSG